MCGFYWNDDSKSQNTHFYINTDLLLHSQGQITELYSIYLTQTLWSASFLNFQGKIIPYSKSKFWRVALRLGCITKNFERILIQSNNNIRWWVLIMKAISVEFSVTYSQSPLTTKFSKFQATGWNWRELNRSLKETLSILCLLDRESFDSWIKRDQLDVTCFIISLFNAQQVSAVNTSILRNLRLIYWVISWVVLLWFYVCWCYVVVWLWWCGVVSVCRLRH